MQGWVAVISTLTLDNLRGKDRKGDPAGVRVRRWVGQRAWSQQIALCSYRSPGAQAGNSLLFLPHPTGASLMFFSALN